MVQSKRVGRKAHEEPENVLTPTSVFRNRTLSVFEAWVVYLKDEQKLSFKQIALLTNRDIRNIWTVYRRATQK